MGRFQYKLLRQCGLCSLFALLPWASGWKEGACRLVKDAHSIGVESEEVQRKGRTCSKLSSQGKGGLDAATARS